MDITDIATRQAGRKIVTINLSFIGSFRRWRMILVILFAAYVPASMVHSLSMWQISSFFSDQFAVEEAAKASGIDPEVASKEIKQYILDNNTSLSVAMALNLCSLVFLALIFLLFTKKTEISRHVFPVSIALGLVRIVDRAYFYELGLILSELSPLRWAASVVESCIVSFVMIYASYRCYDALSRTGGSLIIADGKDYDASRLLSYMKRRPNLGIKIPRLRFSWLAVPHFVACGILLVVGIPLLALPLLGWVAGALVLTFAAKQYNVARRILLLKASEVRNEDWRPPILVIRSFLDESIKIRSFFFSPARVFSRRGVTFEEFMSERFSRLGPVIAITGDGKEIAPFGAAREFATEENWRNRISNLFDEARIIVVWVGDTPSLLWEIEQALSQGHSGKVMFLFPPLSGNELSRRWSQMQSIPHIPELDLASCFSPHSPDDDKCNLVYMLDSAGRYIRFVADDNGGRYYDMALRAAIGMSLDFPVKIMRHG